MAYSLNKYLPLLQKIVAGVNLIIGKTLFSVRLNFLVR